MTTDSLRTNLNDELVTMLTNAVETAELAAPFISYPVATEFAAIASTSAATWRLLTHLDPGATSSGHLSTVGLRALLNAGVVIRSLPGLHAKVYLADGAGFVGSANLTMTALGTRTPPNRELTVRLDPAQAAEGGEIVEAWWAMASHVDSAVLDAVDEVARTLPKPVPAPSGPADEPVDVGAIAAQLLDEAQSVGLWAKAVDDANDPPIWQDGDWFSNQKRYEPKFKVGDLVLIYTKSLRACNAIVQVTSLAALQPERLIAAGWALEDAQRWPWVNDVRGRLIAAAAGGITPAELGFSPVGLRNGYRKLEPDAFAKAVRHFAGDVEIP